MSNDFLVDDPSPVVHIVHTMNPLSQKPSVTPLRFDFKHWAGVVACGILLHPAMRAKAYPSRYGWGLYLLALSFLIAYVLTPVAGRVAARVGAVDHPSGRKAHASATPYFGGAAIYAAFAAVVLLNFYFSVELKGVALGATLIFVVGLLDDIWNLSARLKLLAQGVAVVILIKYNVSISFLPDTWWGDAGEVLLTGLWVIGITNAFNFIDGLDGLATGSAAINAFFFGLVAFMTDQQFMMFLSAALMGSCLGFLPHNFRRSRPAGIFMGDAGSNFLGFTLAGIGVMGDWGRNHLSDIIVPVLILGVPIFDTTLTTVVRVWSSQVKTFNEWIAFTGRDHFHHRLSDLGLGNRTAVLVIYTITAWAGLSGLLLKDATGMSAVLALMQSAIIFLLIGGFMVFVKDQYARMAGVVNPKSGDE
ncbi:MAG: undecaprenyl/decaprenyl-phosphate alpha-N-acetylglucosaminyl 1-phosphate transferase [Candidatus Latescibacteria bacterium]|nr:undecaprenyl/decaprenyl-phosphate alpha-N-acetylglucosaminyl 1-phosphate transferase [Candidatus Latescibacterota bacterium]